MKKQTIAALCGFALVCISGPVMSQNTLCENVTDTTGPLCENNLNTYCKWVSTTVTNAKDSSVTVGKCVPTSAGLDAKCCYDTTEVAGVPVTKYCNEHMTQSACVGGNN